VGSGLTAAAVERGGADLLMVLSAGHFRAQGVDSVAALLPYASANDLKGYQNISRRTSRQYP